MPRRPSASAGVVSNPNTPHTSTPHLHRQTESRDILLPPTHANFHQPSVPSLHPPPSTTPQQKVIQVLVNRLKSKLPCNSGLSLDNVESHQPTRQAIETLVELSRDSLGLIAWALCELLDRLAKQTDVQTGHLTIEVLQSQLFILKVLSMAMASRWTRTEAQANEEEQPVSPEPSSPSPSTSKRQQAPSVYSSAPSWQEPPPLDDACVRYILSVMVLFMRQTAPSDTPLMLQTRSTDISFRDFEDNVNLQQAEAPPPPNPSPAVLRTQSSSGSVKSTKMSIKTTSYLAATNTKYEKTHMSLVKSALSVNNLIANYVGRVIFHISASNWNIVSERLQARIKHLAKNPDRDNDLVDLQLISHSVLDRQRLVHLLNQLSSLVLNMRKEAHVAIAIHLRVAIWNWIDIFPDEFNEAIRTRGKMEGAPERVFDLLHSLIPPGNEKTFWPTLTVLNCITSERIAADFQYGNPVPKGGRKEVRFSENLLKHLSNSSKLSEIALACAVDMCRAAAYIEPYGEVPLKLVASDIAHEIKGALYACPGGRGKAFWDCHEDIDIALYADALVAVFRFLPREDSKPLILACTDSERSDPAKTCAIRASLTLAEDTGRFPWQKGIEDVAIWIATRCRDVLKGAGVRRAEVDQYGVAKRVANRPRARRTFPEPLTDREILILGILSLWRANILFFMRGINGRDDVAAWVSAAVRLWEAPIDITVKISTATTMRKVSEATFMTPATDPTYVLLTDIVKLSLPETLLSVVGNLLTTRSDQEAQRLWVSLALQVIDVYVAKVDIPHVKEVQVDPRRIPAFAVAEIAFLVALPLADNAVSQQAARGLRLLSHAERQVGAPVNTTMTDEDRSKRDPIYEQLGDPRVTVVGRLGHQKRIRKLVRLLSFSSGVHVVVWEECYWRWRALNEALFNSIGDGASAEGADVRGNLNSTQQHFRNQWQNLTLFLASMSRACIQDNRGSPSLSGVIPPKFLPDKLRVIQNPGPMVGDFIADLINLLVVGEPQIREIVRDALGCELSPRLYSKLIRNLEDSIDALEQNQGSGDFETFALVLDQILSILKLISENKEVSLEDVMNVEISSVMQTLVHFLNRYPGVAAYRMKMKYCLLCESVCNRTDTLTIRKDSPARHEILDIILSWMIPSPPAGNMEQVHHDLNMTCLRAAVKLLDRLQLRPPEVSSTGDDIVHVMSRLFNKYSSALLSSISTCQAEVTPSDSASDLGSIHQKMRISQKEAELRELVITGLTHLVSANSESGFKQCLPLAYDQDTRKRIIFAHVFARVIGEGTVFDPEDKSLTKTRHAALFELVRSSDLVLAMTICEICPPNEVEIMISVLLNIFDSRPSLLALIKLMIEKEVAQTANETAIFRGNSTCARFLSAFARLHGYNYLRNLIQPLLQTMLAMPPGASYEIDPTKAAGQDVIQNQKNIEYVASQFLKLISDSMDALPGMFRQICAHIGEVVSDVYPGSRYAAMGAFMFLRFISPAVVTPETIDLEIPKTENHLVIRRGLMVIAKIIQNLANNIFFGKEQHMTILNKFLEGKIANVTKFLSDIHRKDIAYDDSDTWTGTTSDDTDIIVLHRFLHKHADKIGKELLSLSKPSPDYDMSAASGKRAWDGLCALLVDLGSPMEVPHLSPLHSHNHPEYLELLERHSGRSTASVSHLFVETDIHEHTAVFILRLASIDVEGLDIELFMYHILRTLASDAYRLRPFDIVLDCTSFSPISEVPLQWLKYCAELIPADLRLRFSTTRILNPNTLAQKYLRRLYNISAGTPLCHDIKVYTSVLELNEDVQTTAFSHLAYPVSLEQEPQEIFSDVSMSSPTKTPVTMRVGTTHIRVTSVKSLPISPGLSCQSTEIIPLSDISDIYNISSGRDVNEFIIRKRQGGTVYFSSPSRDMLIKAIRSAKGRLKETPAALTERFSRFSNVPATLLHIGFLSVDLDDEELRGAAYDLLAAVCNYLKYDKNPIVSSKAGFIPGDPIAFVVTLSERLADFAPQLTLDFIHEVSAAMTSMEKASVAHRLSCLQYMSPWIRNLSHFANPTHPLFERSGARLRDCIRTLTDLSVTFPETASTIQKYVWAEVAKLDTNIIDKILDELVRTATDGGTGTRRCETISHIVASLSSVNVRGRIYGKLRKALNKVSAKVCNSLTDYANWTEISTLIRLCLFVGSQSTNHGQNYFYVPEIIHLISLVACEGPALIRKSVYGVVMNLLQELYLARPDDSTEPGLQQLMNDLTLAENLKLFGLRRETPTSEYTNTEQFNEKDTLDNIEKLVWLLVRIMEVSAGSPGLLNVWKARWMSLVTATAFQLSPAIQTRSFLVLSILATAEVDDDYLYQMLVAFRNGLVKANEANTMALVSMLRCMCKIIPAIRDCRYVHSLFWLAVALLQSSHLAFYVEATSLLRITLEGMEQQGSFRDTTVHAALLDAREPLEDVTCQLDELLRISFDASFSFSLAAVILKGMRNRLLKADAETSLRALLRISSAHEVEDMSNGPQDHPHPEVLGYFLALLPVSTTMKAYRQLLMDSGIDGSYAMTDDPDGDDYAIPRITTASLGIHDATAALLVSSFVSTMLLSAQGDDAETQMLYGLLSDIAQYFPEVISMVYDGMQERIKDTFANSSNAYIIRSVSNIFRVALQDSSRPPPSTLNHGSSSTLSTVDENSINAGRNLLSALDELGMQGLAHNYSFLPLNKGHATKMIQWIPQLLNHIF